jgi:hypothetical protein
MSDQVTAEAMAELRKRDLIAPQTNGKGPSDVSGTPSPTLPEMSRTLSEVEGIFRSWLHLPDLRPLRTVLGTIAANRLEGDPVWTLLIGPPGSGKTEILQAATKLDNVFPIATLTEAALLSGTAQRERAKDAKGGLLREIGDHGTIVCKDFGSVLSMHRDARAAVLAALREIYDGSWTRSVGTDGGQSLHWSGKVGLLGGATQSIDRHHAVMAAMGERCILSRMPKIDAEKQAGKALDHAARGKTMRTELADAVRSLFASELRVPRTLSEIERDHLISLAILSVHSRSAVERDGYKREVELVPDAEAPARLVVVLERLLAGLDSIGLERAEAWTVIRETALDSIPALRRRVLVHLSTIEGPRATTEIAEALDYPTQTARRALEDLNLHGITQKLSQGQGKADLWRLSERAATRYVKALTVPEVSDTTNRTFPETSETVTVEQVAVSFGVEDQLQQNRPVTNEGRTR